MELSSHHHHEEVEIPMPINSSFVGVHAHHGQHFQHGHITHHHHHEPTSSSHNQHNIVPPSNNSNGGTSSTITTTNATTMEEDDNIHHHKHHHHTHHLSDINVYNSNANTHDHDDDDHDEKKAMIRYKECLKNHAASMGGNARDGCGEFMPSGEEGTLEHLTCLACKCHRNFHRKEIQGQNHIIPPLSTTTTHSLFYPSTPHHHLLNNRGRNVILGSTPSGHIVPYPKSLTINMPPSTYTSLSDQSDHHHHHHHHGNMVRGQHAYDYNQVVKKRFRTKFSQEQKEKMVEFAEKVGWKIQKQEESVVQQFCQEIGVKRRVLKVWMHNNKHNLAKKNDNVESQGIAQC